MTRSRIELPKRPTVADLAHQVDELHACTDDRFNTLERHFADLADTVKQDRHDSKNRDQIVAAQLAGLQTSVTAMTQFFGIAVARPHDGEEVKPPRTVGGWSQWQAMAGVGSAVIAALGAYRLLDGLIVAVFKAAHTFLMNPPH